MVVSKKTVAVLWQYQAIIMQIMDMAGIYICAMGGSLL